MNRNVHFLSKWTKRPKRPYLLAKRNEMFFLVRLVFWSVKAFPVVSTYRGVFRVKTKSMATFGPIGPKIPPIYGRK